VPSWARGRGRRTRTAIRLALPLVVAAAGWLVAAPAHAVVENGEVPAPGLSAWYILGVYVGIPLGLFVLITLAVVGPILARRPRYRPGRSWSYDPVWFAGPADPQLALRDAVPTLHAKGGVGADW
jgi:hypothetical protein